ncbi:MAG: DUF6512 family protein [Eubacterium sp.]
MEKYLKKSNIRAFFFIAVIGTLLHFTYEWTGKNLLVGLFSAVNESTWEHMKLLFMPAFFYFLFESKKYRTGLRKSSDFPDMRAACGSAVYPCRFLHLYRHHRRSFLAADIAIFYFGVPDSVHQQPHEKPTFPHFSGGAAPADCCVPRFSEYLHSSPLHTLISFWIP